MSNGRKDVQERLKSKGYRLTPQRQAVLDFLRSVTSHPNAEEIYHAVKKKIPSISFGTVYRTLNILKEAGLIQELAYGKAFSHYDGNPKEHYHIICSKCGRIDDIDLPVLGDLKRRAASITDFSVTSHRLEFYGICPDCC